MKRQCLVSTGKWLEKEKGGAAEELQVQISRTVNRDAKSAPRRSQTGPARVAGRKQRASVGMTNKTSTAKAAGTAEKEKRAPSTRHRYRGDSLRATILAGSSISNRKSKILETHVSH
jgi:hypothetical protein